MAGAFFAQSRQPGATVQLTIDGKTLRGSIGAGETRGEHLLAAYLPGEGVVLAQVAVDRKENEITAAPRLLETIDLRDKVVSGDAMLTQRELSRQVVERGGDYLWSVKDNQPQLRDDLATCFADASPSEPGLATTGLATTVEKGHGRVEQRRLWASADLNDYLDWPYVQQVFRLDRHTQVRQNGRRNQRDRLWRNQFVLGTGGPATTALLGPWTLEYRKRLALPARRNAAGGLVPPAVRPYATHDGGNQQSGSGIAAAARGQKRATATPPLRGPLG